MVVPTEYASRREGGVPRLPPVVGGSGRRYWTVTDALAGESGILVSVTALAAQAGTTAGSVIGPGTLSATDDTYNDYWLVDQTSTPSDGMVRRFARVSDYVGATKQLIIDKPWNYSGETFFLVQPIRISLEEDIREDITITQIGVELNLAGHRIRGAVSISAASFVWIRDGWVTNGIQATNDVSLLLTDLTVSRRDATIYALLVAPTAQHRTVARNCEFRGVVAGRSGRCGWEIQDCTNNGLADGVPYRLVESIAGVSITMTQLDVSISGPFSGCFLYSENSITGATAFVSVQACIETAKDFYGIGTQNRRFAFARATGSATLTPTFTTGSVNIKLGILQSQPLTLSAELNFTTGFPFTASMLSVSDFTGTATLDFNMTNGVYLVESDTTCYLAGVVIEGTVNMSGTVTLQSGGSNVFPNFRSARGTVSLIVLACQVSGTVTNSLLCGVMGANGVFGIVVRTAQTVACTITLSGGFVGEYCLVGRPFNLDSSTASVSAGTFNISAALVSRAMCNWSVAPGTTVTGGTITVSGLIIVSFVNGNGTFQYRLSGAGGTLTVSNTQNYTGGRFTTFELASSTGAGATVTNSGATITVEGMVISSTGAWANASTSTSTASVSGTVSFRHVMWITASTMVNATAVGGAVTGPGTVNFEFVNFTSTLTDRSGSGTITWASATLRFRSCHVEGLLTFTGTSFSTVEAFMTTFNGNSSNESISASGTRPTTYRLWDCTRRAIVDDLKPEILDDYATFPAAAAFVQGQPLTINASAQAAACVATSIVEGSSMDAPAGAGNPVVLVKSGRLFLNVEAGVAAGDNLSLDLVTPTRYDTSAFTGSQQGGRALEAAGATVAGKAYSEVSLR